jgi:hypothetical protein
MALDDQKRWFCTGISLPGGSPKFPRLTAATLWMPTKAAALAELENVVAWIGAECRDVGAQLPVDTTETVRAYYLSRLVGSSIRFPFDGTPEKIPVPRTPVACACH